MQVTKEVPPEDTTIQHQTQTIQVAQVTRRVSNQIL